MQLRFEVVHLDVIHPRTVRWDETVPNRVRSDVTDPNMC